MTSKHTPGPWSIDGEGTNAMVRGADLTIVAVRHRLTGQTHEANARLIAAAPELLEALEDLVYLAEAAMREVGEYDIEAELADARAAIAKARGEPC